MKLQEKDEVVGTARKQGKDVGIRDEEKRKKNTSRSATMILRSMHDGKSLIVDSTSRTDRGMSGREIMRGYRRHRLKLPVTTFVVR